MSVLLCVQLLCAGCASMPTTDCISIGRNGSFCPLAPAKLPAVQVVDMIEFNHGGRREVFLGQLQTDAGAMRFAATTLFGTSLFTITYDGRQVRNSPPHTNTHADLLVAMLELSLASPKILQAQLHNLSLQVHADQDGQVRELYEQGRLVARIALSGTVPDKMHVSVQLPLENISIRITPIS
jgi:hypothetical protein